MISKRIRVIPRGMIELWSGTIATIPIGWALCNGSNGTPDLRDKFIVCAKQDDAGVAKTNIEGALRRTGGLVSHEHLVSPTDTTLELDGTIADSGPGNAYSYTVSGYTDLQPNVPPYYALAFIMKL